MSSYGQRVKWWADNLATNVKREEVNCACVLCPAVSAALTGRTKW